MRHNQNRRSRGRNNRKGPNPLTRSYESNGPDVKVRGTASHVADKYMTLARDAQSSGDTVAAENYLQHAEHYNRIVMAAQAQFQQAQAQYREDGGQGDNYDDDRQMNGRPRDRFDFGGEGREGDDGDDRFDGGEGEDDRFRPMQQSRQHDQDQRPRDQDQRPRDQDQRPRDQDQRPRGPRPDRFDRRDRNERNDRHDRNDRQDYREGGNRPDRFQRMDEPQPDMPPPLPVEASAPPAPDENGSQPRRRRGRPRNDDQGNGAEGETSDGAAALAAFPDR